MGLRLPRIIWQTVRVDKMRWVLFAFIFLLFGCPKQSLPSLEEQEKERELKELLEEEDEIFDDLPEAGEDDEE